MGKKRWNVTKKKEKAGAKTDGKKTEKQTVANLKLSEAEALKLHIANDVKKEVKRWVWRPIAILLAIGGFLGYTSYTAIKSLQKKIIDRAERDLEMQVRSIYDEENVIRIVNKVIKQDANDLIERKVEAMAEPIVRDLTRQQQEYSQIIADFKKDQEVYAQMVVFNQLIMKAEMGDVEAYNALVKIASASKGELRESAVLSSRRIYDMFFSPNIIYRYYTDDMPDSEVIRNIESKNQITRKWAIGTVRKRRMYGQVEALIERVSVEPNLDVLAAIQSTLNELLDAKVDIFRDGAKASAELWAKKRDELLKNQKGDK